MIVAISSYLPDKKKFLFFCKKLKNFLNFVKSSPTGHIVLFPLLYYNLVSQFA